MTVDKLWWDLWCAIWKVIAWMEAYSESEAKRQCLLLHGPACDLKGHWFAPWTKQKDERHIKLMHVLRQQADQRVRALGFEIGQVVEFTKRELRRDPGWRGQWVVVGAVPGTDRIELDRWPREQTYTAVEAGCLKPATGCK